MNKFSDVAARLDASEPLVSVGMSPLPDLDSKGCALDGKQPLRQLHSERTGAGPGALIVCESCRMSLPSIVFVGTVCSTCDREPRHKPETFGQRNRRISGELKGWVTAVREGWL